ncbi:MULTISPECIES: helix-turn-helix domain-containing protein [unclassified Streptosporangium]|uniref:helix-turn-helix domain-containing protein n=1 Tax=unclassified Streptosporangium TaxID=2632669 RepID=UPI002E2BBA74|nr:MULTISPECIES: helix-turn-helix transcriptional regulator [unclassified Streptosporangium]
MPSSNVEPHGPSPTLRARRLAVELTSRRDAAGLTREEAARRLEWSPSTIFRIETGRTRPQPRSVRELLDLYGVTGAERDGLIQLARDARQPGWWHSFRDVLPNPYEVYIGLEAGAASLRNFEPMIIPGLLQTADYARASVKGGAEELDADEIDRLVEVRLTRQQILTRQDRPRLWAIIDEAVIHRVVGSPAIMREQLHQLIAAAEEGKTTLQVVPFSGGAHAGTTGPFVIFGFPEPTDPHVVYVETLAGDLYLEKHADVARYTIAFERLRATALSPDDSTDLMKRAADSLT